jgi:hypothetical protein
MATDDDTTTTPAPTSCKSAADQLKDVKDAINEFETRKLGELKTALEKFVADQDKKVADYKSKYTDLKDRWIQQQREITTLAVSIANCFPDPQVKRIKDCICEPELKISDLAKKIDARKKECRPCETQRDKAQVAYDKANGWLDSLVNLATKLEEALDVNGGKQPENGKGGLIKAIREKLTQPDRSLALYMWIKLLDLHRRIQPDDLTDDYKKPPAFKDYCGAPSSTASETDAYSACGAVSAAPLPRLLDPLKYSGLLDCAFQCFNDTKLALARAESEVKRKNDELDGWIKERGERIKSKDTDITNCLKALKPGEPCCPETNSGTTGA